jgi:hypothetical protein
MIIATIIPAAGMAIKNNVPYVIKPGIQWEKTYGEELIDWGNCIQSTSDGGYIISGTNFRNAWSLWYSYFYLIKIDSNGNEEWHQIFGEYDSEHVAKSVQQTTDGGYIVAGYQGVTYQYDAIVHKTDTDGNIVWSCTFGDPNEYDIAESIQQTADGGYIITGWTNSYHAVGTDALLIKLDTNGSEEWVKTLGGSESDAGSCVRQTSDGGFIVVGHSDSFSDSGDVYLVKTDSSGNEEWYQTYGSTGWDGGYNVDLTSDGGYIITGRYENEDWNTDVLLIKTDSSGNEEWSQYFGGSEYDEGYSVQQTSDGGYFITGSYTDSENYDPDVYLIKTDAFGNEEWSKKIDNGHTEDVGYYGIQTSYNEYIVAGFTGFYIEEIMDVWVIKLGGSNHAPTAPSIDGPTSAKKDIAYNYTFIATDFDRDEVYYYIDWGDGCPCKEWFGPYTSGDKVNISHSFNNKGTYTIKAKVKDSSDAESEWGTFEVNIPRARIANNSFIQLLLEIFPNAFLFLRYLLGFI